MKIGHQPDGWPAAVCWSSKYTPILTDERPPLGADGPLRRIEILCDLSTTSRREDITSSHKAMPERHPSFNPPRPEAARQAACSNIGSPRRLIEGLMNGHVREEVAETAVAAVRDGNAARRDGEPVDGAQIHVGRAKH